MTTPPSPRHDGQPADDLDALQAEIEATRAHLSRTVDELGARFDVPARAREGAARAKDTAVETYRESPPLVIGAAVALVGVVVAVMILRRKRTTRRRKR